MACTFEAEAFVIDRLDGPHVDGPAQGSQFPQCQFVYAVNAADESDGVSGGEPYARRDREGDLRELPLQRASLRTEFQGRPNPVLKCPLTCRLHGASDPSAEGRRGVSLSRGARNEHIKRLAAAGETLRIWHGAINQAAGGSRLAPATSPGPISARLQMAVYDDSKRATALEGRRMAAHGGVDGREWTEDGTEPGTYRINPASIWMRAEIAIATSCPTRSSGGDERRETPSRPPHQA